MDALRSGLLAVMIAAAPAAAHAQAGAYPTKPIRLILPFPPGAPSDLVGRAVAQKLGEQLGENLIPDNRVG
ncbi:MAG TPA: tripartite tricarboxylate transporter substrate binding protein, partial [Burkholderiales bacterium]|nr:tripartite tricarboxylate transporter substrate binding protein [Burkholderiales bacterium]